MRIAILFLLMGFVQVRGESPLQPALRDYIHTAWTQHDGLPIPAIGGMIQTPDGYLWLMTSEEALLRFDGVRFVAITTPCKRPDAILNDGGGGLWLGCGAQFFHRDSSGAIKAGPRQSLPPGHQREAAGSFVDRAGRFWSWGRSLSYFLPDGSPGPEIPGTLRPPDATGSAYAEDSEGNLWFANAQGLMRVRGNQATTVRQGSFRALAQSGTGGVYAPIN